MNNLNKNLEEFFIEFVDVIFADIFSFFILLLTPWRSQNHKAVRVEMNLWWSSNPIPKSSIRIKMLVGQILLLFILM